MKVESAKWVCERRGERRSRHSWVGLLTVTSSTFFFFPRRLVDVTRGVDFVKCDVADVWPSV